MAIPSYASTEWTGLGHATLRFRPKRKSTHPVEAQQIDCYLSAVYISEYGEKKAVKGSETMEGTGTMERNETLEKNETVELQFQNDLKPPGISPELWTAWEEHWEAWKEVLIPLSWVHKYRDHCTPEYIKWHDSYLEDYPDILPLITNELGTSELSEDTLKQSLGFVSQSDLEANTIDYDYLYGEESEQDNESASDLQETVGDEPGPTEQRKCVSGEPGRSECSKGVTQKPPYNKNLQFSDEVDVSEFYEDIYCDKTTETSLNCHGHEMTISDVAEVNLQQAVASDMIAGVNAAAEATIQGSDEKRKKVMDELYEKHTKQRYLVELRRFLHLSGIECHPEIESFYEEKAGIKFFLPSCAESGSSMTENRGEDKAKDNKGRQQQMEKDKQELEENNPERLTSKERLGGSPDSPQEASGSSSGKEDFISDPSIEDPSDNKQDMTVKKRKQQMKTKKKRKGDTARTQGLSWALKYVQQKGSKQTEDIQGTSEAISVSLEPQEAVAASSEVSCGSQEVAIGSHKKTSGFYKARCGSPEAVSGSSEATPGFPVAIPGSHGVVHESSEKAFESSEAGHGSLQTDPEFLEIATELSLLTAGSSKSATSNTDEESASYDSGDAVRYFLDEMAEDERRYRKKYHKEMEEKALQESLQKKPTRLSQLKAACQAIMSKAAASLQEMLLPLTAIHILNLAFPGTTVIEYESSVTEEVPGERERLKSRFDDFVYDKKIRLQRYLPKLRKFCLTLWTDAVVPVSICHLNNLVFQYVSGTEHRFPPIIFGVRWLPDPQSSFCVDGKNVKRCQRRFHKWLEVQDPNLSPSATVELRGMVMNRMNYSDQDPRKSQRLYQQVLREKEDRTEGGCLCLTLHTLHLLQESNKTGLDGSNEGVEVEWPKVEVTFDQDGVSAVTNSDLTSQSTEDTEVKAEAEMWQRIISGCRRLTFWESDNSMPPHLPREIQKYWAQRYRLFLKYDEGINLDTESWYSVTPELLAAHQARRCRCEVVVDALCGAGGNAIQLAKTCHHVIAIDKDPKKVHLARQNAKVYGVADRIDFRVGDFFKLAPSLKADVVFLSPPWGGMEYQEECVYDVYRLGGSMNCARLLRAARAITPNIALYLPRNSNLCQVIALAGVDGVVDIEANYMGPKKKAITAYFGELATNAGWY